MPSADSMNKRDTIEERKLCPQRRSRNDSVYPFLILYNGRASFSLLRKTVAVWFESDGLFLHPAKSVASNRDNNWLQHAKARLRLKKVSGWEKPTEIGKRGKILFIPTDAIFRSFFSSLVGMCNATRCNNAFFRMKFLDIFKTIFLNLTLYLGAHISLLVKRAANRLLRYFYRLVITPVNLGLGMQRDVNRNAHWREGIKLCWRS